MIWREKRTEKKSVTVYLYGNKVNEIRTNVIPGGWDICPVCVKRSEVEYGAEK
jgi:hypothetical protein